MRTSEVTALPVAKPEYDPTNERVMRRTVEQTFASIHSDIRSVRDGNDAPASLAQRRFQFLLMGA